jgi:hypothetical protein
MSRLLLMGLVGTAIIGSLALGGNALAQRDAGAKARGDMRGFWDQGIRRSGGPSVVYQPASPRSESYRRFSYQPIEIERGDFVVVQGDNVQMMRGKDVVGIVPKGSEFKVTKVVNGWLGGVVDVEGQKLNGWVRHNAVSPKQQAAAESSESARNESSAQAIRRFSYEPAPSTTSYRTYERRKEPWQYPKTDPRRYRP